jgi:hypothetical protein
MAIGRPALVRDTGVRGGDTTLVGRQISSLIEIEARARVVACGTSLSGGGGYSRGSFVFT